MGLTYKIQKAMEWERETEALRAGVPQRDIDLSRRCGVDARDVRVFREFSGKGFLIVVRCPKTTARAWHGLIRPKPISEKDPTGESGVLVNKKGRMFVSDYDLMSIWCRRGSGWRKVMTSAAHGASRGPYRAEGQTILKELNGKLVSRIMHGCQDDFCSPQNPGVKMNDHFVGFSNNVGEYYANPMLCKMFYERKGLVWLYNSAGAYLLDVARKELAK